MLTPLTYFKIAVIFVSIFAGIYETILTQYYVSAGNNIIAILWFMNPLLQPHSKQYCDITATTLT